MPRRRFALLAIPVAIITEMGVWRDLEPDGLAAVVYVSMVVGMLAVGAFGGWRGVIVFVPVFAVAAAIEEAWVYEAPAGTDCDPFCSSPEVGLAPFVLPFLLLLMGMGIAARFAVQGATARWSSSR